MQHYGQFSGLIYENRKKGGNYMKKKIIITIAALLAVFMLGISAGALILNSGIGISTGHVIITGNGTCFLVRDNTPIRLSDYSESRNVLPELKSGDKVLVIHDAIAESYPASTLCRLCIKTGDGSISDIPGEVISSLTELGWLGSDSPESPLVFSDEPVFIGNENANFSISVPEGWSYETDESGLLSEYKFYSMRIFLSSDPENAVVVDCTDTFVTCGTGLRTEEVSVNGYSASMGIYEGDSAFSYISFDNTPGHYLILNYADGPWWQKHKEEVREILSTLKIADGILFREEALAIAKKQAKGEYKQAYNEYSCADGVWTFNFETEETAQSIKIDKNGNILYNAKT